MELFKGRVHFRKKMANKKGYKKVTVADLTSYKKTVFEHNFGPGGREFEEASL